jgi:uncharacterized membrane protein
MMLKVRHGTPIQALPARFAGGAFSFQNRLGWRLSSVKELKAKAKEPTRAGAI